MTVSETRRYVTVLAMLAMTNALGQARQSVDCTSQACVATVSWAPAGSPGLTGCQLYVELQAHGAVGVVTVPDTECRMSLGVLPRGVYDIRASGINEFGEGQAGAPVVLGTPVDQPQNLHRQPHR